MLLFLQLRLPSQPNSVQEGGPEGGCDILRDTSELVRHFRRPSTRSEPPNRGWTSVVSDNDANLAKLHPYTGLVVFIMPLMVTLTHVLLTYGASVQKESHNSVALKDSFSANGRHAPDHERALILTAAHKRFWTVCRIRILVAVSDMPKTTIDQKRN